MNFFEFIKDYPEMGTVTVATVFTAFGFVVKSILNFIIEREKRKNEIKDFFWKEKIHSAKKASEYYLHHMGLISLISSRYEILISENSGDSELIRNTEELIKIYRDKLLNFPHYEHHHINLFYDFQSEEISKIQKSDNLANQLIYSIKFEDKDNLETTNQKIDLIRENFVILKNNSQMIFDIYKLYIKTVREDIKKFTD